MFRQVAEDVYALSVEFRVGPMDLGGRMTAVRLPDGGLWLHSPVRFGPEARAAVDALGPVRFLVAPNLMHHLHVRDWAAAYPDAKVAAPAALQGKRPDLRIDVALGDAAEAGWAGVLDQVLVRGMPRVDEVLFFHRPSRTLFVTDLAFNVHRTGSWFTRVYLKLSGAWQRLAPSLLARSVVKDRQAVRASLARAQAWDVARVVVCHGDVVEQGAQEAVRNAFARF
ncbi:DUF4336 domain-containing protein [Corallococcus macrosporus]|uniref:DUF4336 domain-containing protein n=1 Tax=Corallococcus macrosporus DSM 14697 TaxID=1189310 RepID=A0A250K464_9BACT|nr:DUF4336 domain-containing protein [Corallococcus macrosporus]ATB50690.1 hypothetical protein MYMAC_006346 [Corallococcus macrosporus DSM 14697]